MQNIGKISNSYLKKDKSLRLVKFEKKHISKKYLIWLRNKEINNNRQRYSKHTYPSAIKYLQNTKKTNTLFFAIEVYKQSKYSHIGNAILLLDRQNQRAHLSILIGDTTMKNKGLGFLVWKKLIDIAFKNLACKLVVAGTMNSNKPMFKIFKKCKMKILVLPGYFFQNRKKDDLIIAYKTRKK